MTEPLERGFRKYRIDRLEFGNQQFGHAGEHLGLGSGDCPWTIHHHCDAFCAMPTLDEIIMAGLNPKKFRVKSRK